MSEIKNPWAGHTPDQQKTQIEKNWEGAVRREVALREEPDQYVYSFQPFLSKVDIDRVDWKDINSKIKGGFIQLQKVVDGPDVAIVVLKKDTDADIVSAIFRRLHEAALADVHVTSEQYPSARKDEEQKWKLAEVVTMGEDEALGYAGDMPVIGQPFVKKGPAIIKPGKDERYYLDYPAGTRVIVKRADGSEASRFVM